MDTETHLIVLFFKQCKTKHQKKVVLVEIPTVTAMFEHSLFLLIDDWKILSKYVAMISVTGTLKLFSSVKI